MLCRVVQAAVEMLGCSVDSKNPDHRRRCFVGSWSWAGGQAGLRRPGMGGGDAQEAAFAGGPSVRGISRRRGRRQWHLPQQVCPSSLLFLRSHNTATQVKQL